MRAATKMSVLIHSGAKILTAYCDENDNFFDDLNWDEAFVDIYLLMLRE